MRKARIRSYPQGREASSSRKVRMLTVMFVCVIARRSTRYFVADHFVVQVGRPALSVSSSFAEVAAAKAVHWPLPRTPSSNSQVAVLGAGT